MISIKQYLFYFILTTRFGQLAETCCQDKIKIDIVVLGGNCFTSFYSENTRECYLQEYVRSVSAMKLGRTHSTDRWRRT
jgi:hypothetical protein